MFSKGLFSDVTVSIIPDYFCQMVVELCYLKIKCILRFKCFGTETYQYACTAQYKLNVYLVPFKNCTGAEHYLLIYLKEIKVTFLYKQQTILMIH